MASPYVEVILGVAFGVMVGVLPALAAMVAGAAAPPLAEHRYARGSVALLSLPIAGAVAVAAGLVTPTPEEIPRIATGGTVVIALSVVGFEGGTGLGSTVHRYGRNPVERGRPLSGDVVDAVDGAGQVTIRPSGAIGSVPGYPELPPALREELAGELWRLPADLPISELETRIERQLERDYDLEAVTVTVSPRGTATVAAAPPVSGLARRVPEDHRAISITTSIPDGVTAGDAVVVETGGGTVEGTVLGADTAGTAVTSTDASGSGIALEDDVPAAGANDQERASSGSSSRLTVAVPTARADELLADRTAPVAVRSRDTRPDYRALSLLDRAGQSVRVSTVDRRLLGAIEDAAGEITVFAAAPSPDANEDDWTFGPAIEDLTPGWQAVLVGDEGRLKRLLDSATATDGGIDA